MHRAVLFRHAHILNDAVIQVILTLLKLLAIQVDLKRSDFGLEGDDDLQPPSVESSDRRIQQMLLRRKNRFEMKRDVITDEKLTGFVIVVISERVLVLKSLVSTRLCIKSVDASGCVVNHVSPTGAGKCLPTLASEKYITCGVAHAGDVTPPNTIRLMRGLVVPLHSRSWLSSCPIAGSVASPLNVSLSLTLRTV